MKTNLPVHYSLDHTEPNQSPEELIAETDRRDIHKERDDDDMFIEHGRES